MSQQRNLVPAMRASLQAKLERLLARPIIARVVGAEDVSEPDDDTEESNPPDLFDAMEEIDRELTTDSQEKLLAKVWKEEEDGTCAVRIDIDYDDLWRGSEKEVLETFKSAQENPVVFLTQKQEELLRKSPREFLELQPPPESAELLEFEQERISGSVRVTRVRVAAAPESRRSIQYVAIVPNLIQLERQLAALRILENSPDTGALGPLRRLVALSEVQPEASTAAPASPVTLNAQLLDPKLDEHQRGCIEKAVSTPHFAVIQGPPGSGKTSVISGIVRQVLDRSAKVLVVSPTHVAVDNVVERLVADLRKSKRDTLDEATLPVRFASRNSRLSAKAKEYWVGRSKQHRAATLSRRIEQILRKSVALADVLYPLEDPNASGHAPLSAAIAAVEPVLCGTPIGLLSCPAVKDAAPGSFDLLIVDEVSKMTLPEFLAIAVKAKRWVLVGDPAQLPPYNNCEENAETLDDVIDAELELACSVAAILARMKPSLRRDKRLVVVAENPELIVEITRAHLQAVLKGEHALVGTAEEIEQAGIVVCTKEELEDVVHAMTERRSRDRTHNPDSRDSIEILVERGLSVSRPHVASGSRLVEPRHRAQAQLFEMACNVYHAKPWSDRAQVLLQVVARRDQMTKMLPSEAAIEALGVESSNAWASLEKRYAILNDIAERFAVNAISVYDWLTGIPHKHFDVSPLAELSHLDRTDLRPEVKSYLSGLRMQYRMQSSLSKLPRELFYFGELLHDGKKDEKEGCFVQLIQVDQKEEVNESNQAEVEAICQRLVRLNEHDTARKEGAQIMVITPYKAQERLLAREIDALRTAGKLEHLGVEVCTLDRCQGREADYVIISLVRRRPTAFFEMPKRWNVALTRAMKGMWLFGDINAYLNEARNARSQSRNSRNGREPRYESLIVRIIESYHGQIARSRRQTTPPRIKNSQ